MNRNPIKDFYGRIIGYIEEDNNGNKTAKDFYGRILGRWFKDSDLTKDFYGRVLARGDILVSLIMQSKENKK